MDLNIMKPIYNKNTANSEKFKECPLRSGEDKKATLINVAANSEPSRSSGPWDWAVWAFCRVCFCCLGFQHDGFLITSTVLGFLCIQLPPHELSPSWASAVLGLCLAGAKPRLFWPGYIWVMAPDMLRECNFLGSVLPQQRFEMVDQCYSLVTARGMRVGWPQRRGLNPS